MSKQSTFSGFMSLTGAALLVKVLSLLYVPVLIGLLTDDGYGLYTASYQIFVVIYAITNSGIPQAISKIVSELTAVGNYKDAVKAFKMSKTILILMGAAFSLIYILLARYISNAVEYPRAYLAIVALGPTIFLSTINSSHRGYFQGRGNMKPTAVVQVFEQIINIIFTLILAFSFLKYGVEAAAGGGAFASSIAALFAALYLLRVYKKNDEAHIGKFHDPNAKRLSNKKIFRRILNYSIPLTAYTAFFNFGNLIDLGVTKTRLMYGAGLTEKEATILFGYLSKYLQFMSIPTALITSLTVILLPAISAAVARKENDVVINKINMSFKICFLIAIPSAVGLSVLSYPIYRLMKYGSGAYIMLYGSFVVILMSCVQIFSAILQGLGRLYQVTIFIGFGILGKIVTNYFMVGIPSINILGVILGNTVNYAIPLILGNIILKKTLKMKINIFVHAVKPAIASGVMGVILFLSYRLLNALLDMIIPGYISVALPALVCIGIGAFTYFYVMVSIKGITGEDMKMLPAKFRRFIPRSIMKKIV
jgi:stage V sporulation protein B